MTRKQETMELPLVYLTPERWAMQALRRPLELLNDHAHLEKKAATNALELLNRWPEPRPPETWVAMMTAIARDETEHLGVVTKLLARRGGRLTRTHKNDYASELRKLVRIGFGNEELMDRLMVSALVEARSCERFALLGRHSLDKEFARLYRGLEASEAGHYRVFIGLAEEVSKPAAVAARWKQMLEAEAVIIQRQTPGPRMHSGLEEQETGDGAGD